MLKLKPKPVKANIDLSFVESLERKERSKESMIDQSASSGDMFLV